MLKKLFLPLIATLSLSFSVVMAPTTLALNCAGADAGSAACEIQGGVNTANGCASGSTCKTDNSGGSISHTLSTVIDILSLVVGVAAVIMIIYAGFKYITSGGNDQNVTAAKNTLLYAVIGLVIVALAQIIVHFVLNQANCAINNDTSTACVGQPSSSTNTPTSPNDRGGPLGP